MLTLMFSGANCLLGYAPTDGTEAFPWNASPAHRSHYTGMWYKFDVGVIVTLLLFSDFGVTGNGARGF